MSKVFTYSSIDRQHARHVLGKQHLTEATLQDRKVSWIEGTQN